MNIDDATAAEAVIKIKAAIAAAEGDTPKVTRFLLSEVALVLGCDGIAPEQGLVRWRDKWIGADKANHPILVALDKAPKGPPMDAEDLRRLEEHKAFRAAGGEGTDTETFMARVRRLKSDDPDVRAAEEAALAERLRDFNAKVIEGRRLLAHGPERLAREVTRLRGILIELAKNHPESAEWIMAMFTPLDGSFDSPKPAAST